MRIVFFTGASFAKRELFRYVYAHVASRFPDTYIVAVRPGDTSSARNRFRRYRRKARRMGILQTMEIATSSPIRRALLRRDRVEVARMLRALPRPSVEPDPRAAVWVGTVNGPDAADAIAELHPDVLIQAGAGILRKRIFEIPRLCTLNVHHGIAPLIKGMASIDWALWEKKREWLGATVHVIDEGIDTGAVLAYAPVRRERPGEGYASLYVRVTEAAVGKLVEVLERLSRGDKWSVDPPPGPRVYRSSFSGWKHLALVVRLWLERCARRSGSEGPDGRDVRESRGRRSGGRGPRPDDP